MVTMYNVYNPLEHTHQTVWVVTAHDHHLESFQGVYETERAARLAVEKSDDSRYDYTIEEHPLHVAPQEHRPAFVGDING